MTIRQIYIVAFILSLFNVFGQKKDTPDDISPGSIKTDYFWNNDRNAKAFKTKSNIVIDSIRNGYYAKKEHLQFVDKKLVSIKYDNGSGTSEIKFPNGTGFLHTNKDTIRLENGKLNGESYFNSYYPIDPYPFIGPPIFSKDLQRTVMTFKDNFLISMLVYRKGILIYESYYKKYDFIKKYNEPIRDSILNVYNSNGSIRYSWKIKNGRFIK